MKGEERHIKDEVLVKYLVGEATGEEQKQVQQWLKTSERNREYLAGLKLIWNESNVLPAASDADVDGAWERFLRRTQQPVQAPRSISYKWVKIAAALLLLAGGSWLVYFVTRTAKPQPMAYKARAVSGENQSPAAAADPAAAAYRDLQDTNDGIENKKVVKGKSRQTKYTASVAGKPTAGTGIPATLSEAAGGGKWTTGDAANRTSTATGISYANIGNSEKPGSKGKNMAEEDEPPLNPAGENKANDRKKLLATREVSLKPRQAFANKSYGKGVFKYDRTNEFICNNTPCPIEICITQTIKCANGEPAAVSTCSVLEPDESGQLRYKAFDQITKNCKATVDEIRIKRVGTGETIVLNADSKPATAEEFFSYITGEKKGDITAGIFHTDCDNNKDDCGLMFDNSQLILH